MTTNCSPCERLLGLALLALSVLGAGLIFAAIMIGLVAVGTATSLRPRPRDLAPVQPTALAGAITLPPYHQRADPSGRAAVAPSGDRTACRT